MHSGALPHLCKYCGKVSQFNQNEFYEKILMFFACSYAVLRPSVLKVMINSCEGYGFLSSFNLKSSIVSGQVKIHERKHNGIKPFKCEFCEKSFAYRESLLTHVSIHTGLKRFMCQACGSRFSCISNLQAHRKSHKSTCGMTPNVTKPVGPMGLETIFKISEVSDN